VTLPDEPSSADRQAYTGSGPMPPGGSTPRVAVVGSGAWGTTLALLLARREPVTLWCHSPETAARIAAEGRNEARLPGVALPALVRATADPAAWTG
jgi:glycerol-3-phosphate dehydrogenase